MKKGKLWMPVLAGLMFGQLSAEGERPLKVINTVRAGYNDNLYRTDDPEKSFFVTDVIDLSLHAVLSDRTDLMVKSQLTLLDDDGGSEFYPNLYAMLNHSVSSRLLLRLSEYYRSGEFTNDRRGGAPVAQDQRYSYFANKVDAMADYVLTRKDRLQGSLGYSIQQHDQKAEELDWTTLSPSVSWKRDIIQQRTYSTLKLAERMTKYDNRDSSFDATDLTAGLNHTFNQSWQGGLEAGVSHVRPDYPSPAENESTLSPLFKAGLVYSPSPRTRFSGDLSHQYSESDDSSYGGQTTTALDLGARHDITAKLMAKATARFASAESDASDNERTADTSNTAERMDLEFRLTYKLNRINFLELGVKHSEESNSNSDHFDWDQNVVDIGWRVELN